MTLVLGATQERPASLKGTTVDPTLALRPLQRFMHDAVQAPIELVKTTVKQVQRLVPGSAPGASDADVSATYVAHHQAFLDLLVRHDRSALEAMITPNAHMNNIAADSCNGRGSILEALNTFRRTMTFVEMSGITLAEGAAAPTTEMSATVWHFTFNTKIDVRQQIVWNEAGRVVQLNHSAADEVVERVKRIRRLQNEYFTLTREEFASVNVAETYDFVSEGVALSDVRQPVFVSAVSTASAAGTSSTDGVPVVQATLLSGAPASAGAAAETSYQRQTAEQERMLGRFDLERKLGAGSFGLVFLGRNKASGETRAIKCIAKEAQDKAALENEVRIMRAASAAAARGEAADGSAYIVRLFETYEGPEHYYLVLEALGGGEVYARLGGMPDGRYTEGDALGVCRQMLAGVVHLHSVGILHRDLKPENLLYASPAADAPVKIADFGLSCFYEDVFHVHDVCGTPLYFAPELLIAGEMHDFDEHGFALTVRRSYGPSVDVWACGCIMYQLLSGEPLFQPTWREARGKWDFDAMNRLILNGGYDVTRSSRGEALGASPPALALLAAMLDRDASRRPPASACLEHEWFRTGAASGEGGAPSRGGAANALAGVTARLADLRTSHRSSRFPPQASVDARTSAKHLYEERRRERSTLPTVTDVN